jgi:RNA polymerase sigma-70 factor (ECF subfamily)
MRPLASEPAEDALGLEVAAAVDVDSAAAGTFPGGAVEPADDALFDAFAAGSATAFEVLYARHGADVKSYARRLLGDAESAQEVFAESFTRLVAAARGGDWEHRGTVRGFLFTIAHRLCMDQLRARRRARRSEADIVALQEWWRGRAGPESDALSAETAGQIERALHRIPAAHREVILLRLVYGFSTEEVGRILGGLEPLQVRSQLSYARRLLRAALERDPRGMGARRTGSSR